MYVEWTARFNPHYSEFNPLRTEVANHGYKMPRLIKPSVNDIQIVEKKSITVQSWTVYITLFIVS